MDNKEILKFCFEKGCLLDQEILKLFQEIEDTETVKIMIEKIKNHTHQGVITKKVFEENKESVREFFLDLPKENQKNLEKLRIKLGLRIEISQEVSRQIVEPLNKEEGEQVNSKRDFSNSDNSVRVVSMPPIISKKIEVGDFVKYFRNRLINMRDYLQEHSELNNLISIGKISGERQGISLIGIVSDKRVTKNRNILLEIEDLTGKIRVLINQNKPELYEKAEELALDSVAGIKGSGNREIVFASDIIFPDSRLLNRKKSPEEELAVFSGDMHIGSKFFMENNFLKFIDYLNGGIPNTPEVSKIKYFFIIGDLIAGVGIFPGQEMELNIPDVEGQYEKAAELLKKIRKDITIIISPGNHDAVRIMEPQPLLDERYAWSIYDLKNVILTNNPALINIGAKANFSGFNVLTYHGYSFHYYADRIPKLMKEKAIHKPEMLMHYLLKHRHLAPTHSSTLYFPSEEDSHLINTIPDIFVSGHTHKSSVTYYNNILTISSSSWESLTPFQEKMGNEPDFCKVPMFNLKTREVKILDFEGE